MGHPRTKQFAAIASILIWVLLLLCTRFLKGALLSDYNSIKILAPVFLLYINLPIAFIWMFSGPRPGILATISSCMFIAIYFDPNVYSIPIISYLTVGFICKHFIKRDYAETKKLEMDIERVYEELNLESQKIEREKNDNLRIRNSLLRVSHLKNIVESCNLTPYEEDTMEMLTESLALIFEHADRILMYLTSEETGELMLASSKKINQSLPIRAKKGDVFDRWVFEHKIPLLVEDAGRDFRFSTEEYSSERGCNSIISTPLIAENKLVGVLRIDSLKTNNFSQTDLRLLDIIGDLSSVSLENVMLYKKVQDLAVHDSLTGLYVQKYFKERLRDEIKRSERSKINSSLIIFDLDNFKTYNDRYGHSAGDVILKHFSSILRRFTEQMDIISRYGGEEFTALLINKNKKTALKIAEKIRNTLKSEPLIFSQEKVFITVSAGVATCPQEGHAEDEILMLVDSRLYEAKKNGKDRVESK